MLRTINKVNKNNVYKVGCFVNYSTKPAVQEKAKPESNENKLQEFVRISNISKRIRNKKPQKPPFVKNLFLGKFDTDILAYPELSSENLSVLKKALNEVQPAFDDSALKSEKKISRAFLQKLAAFKLLGLQASQLMDGRELAVSETCRIMEGVASNFRLKNNVIFNECLGIQTLLKCGSDKQKQKYLQKLINGDLLSAFCVLHSATENTNIRKKTILASDGKTWILNGEKQFVINGSAADIFIVVVPTASINTRTDSADNQLTAFIVERDYGGISSSSHTTPDANLEVSNIIFENVQIPEENVIGVVGQGEKLLGQIYPEFNLSTGVLCATLTRKVINNTIEFYIKNSVEPLLLYKSDAVRSKLAKWTADLYAMESMIYLTSGLMDSYENQDCELESTIVKLFASEQALNCTIECLDQIGAGSTIDNNWCLRLHKEALAQASINESNSSLKLIVALFGLQHAGQEINDLVKKLRNPLFHAHFILRRMWTHRKHTSDKPALNLYLYHHLHPSFVNISNHLEYSVLRLQFATEVLFTRYGQEIVNQHIELNRLANVAIDIYAMTASISRASRSYCIGLQHAEHEMILATTFCSGAVERVKQNIRHIMEGLYKTNDENYRLIGDRMFQLKSYCPVHPLTRNF